MDQFPVSLKAALAVVTYGIAAVSVEMVAAILSPIHVSIRARRLASSM